MAVTIPSTASANSSGTVSSPGLGSGLDVNALVTKLMQVESAPLTALQTKEAGYQAKLSGIGSLQGALSALQSAVAGLQDPATFTAPKASIADATILGATAGGTYVRPRRRSPPGKRSPAARCSQTSSASRSWSSSATGSASVL